MASFRLVPWLSRPRIKKGRLLKLFLRLQLKAYFQKILNNSQHLDIFRVSSSSQAFTYQESKTDKKRKKKWKCNVLEFEIQIKPIDFAYEVALEWFGYPPLQNDCFVELIPANFNVLNWIHHQFSLKNRFNWILVHNMHWLFDNKFVQNEISHLWVCAECSW